jgi:NAD(P)H dehydrogenase (quinone)
MTNASAPQPLIFVTGATGKLGRLVVANLLRRHPASRIVAGVRDVAKGKDLADLGVELRVADYNRVETLEPALRGVDRLLLISGSEVGQRVRQHSAVIHAAKQVGVKLIAYTSVLRADTSALGLAVEHKATEAALIASGLPYLLLRNGWYLENVLGKIDTALKFGEVLTCAADGRFSSATRADYAEATAVALTSPVDAAARTLELAGSSSFTIGEFAQTLSRLSGKVVHARNLSQADFRAALVGAGLPDFVAALLADSDAAAAAGWLYDDSRTLEKLIGRPTTSLAEAIGQALVSLKP